MSGYYFEMFSSYTEVYSCYASASSGCTLDHSNVQLPYFDVKLPGMLLRSVLHIALQCMQPLSYSLRIKQNISVLARSALLRNAPLRFAC